MKNVTLVALALSFALAACSDSNTGTVSFALTARQAAAPAGTLCARVRDPQAELE
jgi:hypothetical protein